MAVLPPTPDNQGTPTRPYLLRALHEWCTDNGFTPYLAVFVDASVRVPMEYVKNNEIVLNVGLEATSGLNLGNEYVEFKARFGGVAREIMVPIDHVIAIYARENGQGMAFPAPSESSGNPSAAPGLKSTASPGLRLASGAAPAAAVVVLTAVSGSGDAPTLDSLPKGQDTAADNDADGDPPDTPPPGGRPSLKRVK